MRLMIASVFEKVFSPEHKCFYWYNKKTGESTWTKSKLLGNSDIKITARTKALSVAEGVVLTARSNLITPKLSPKTISIQVVSTKVKTENFPSSILLHFN